MPTPSRVVTSNFGRRWGRAHQGLDIKVYIGDTIRAAWSGKVRVVRYDARGYGKYVVIRHPNGLETYYGHMSKQLVSANEYVKAGQPQMCIRDRAWVATRDVPRVLTSILRPAFADTL